MKHFIALSSALIAYYIIIRFTEFIYFDGERLGYLGTARALIGMNEPYFYLLLLFNYLIKPFMVYVFIMMLFKLLTKQS